MTTRTSFPYTVLVHTAERTEAFGVFQTLREASEFAASWRRADATNSYSIVNSQGETV